MNQHTMTEIETTDLARIEGGFLVGGDGYCGTPYPAPRPFLIADLAVQVVQIVRAK